jgi:hypothetical protein
MSGEGEAAEAPELVREMREVRRLHTLDDRAQSAAVIEQRENKQRTVIANNVRIDSRKIRRMRVRRSRGKGMDRRDRTRGAKRRKVRERNGRRVVLLHEKAPSTDAFAASTRNPSTRVSS